MKRLLICSFILVLAACSSPRKEGDAADSSVADVEGISDSGMEVETHADVSNPNVPVVRNQGVSNFDLYKKYKEARLAKDSRVASQVASDILSRNPNDPKILNALAVINIEQGKPDMARLMLNKVLSRDPNNSPALNNLGVIELKSENLRLALINFKKAITSDSKNSAAQANLGSIYLQYRNYDAAVAALESAVDNGDSSVETLSNYAVALSGKGDIDKANKYFDKALAKDQNNVTVLVNFSAHLIDRAHDPKKALGVLNKVRFSAHEPAILEKVNGLSRKAEKDMAAKSAPKAGDQK